MLIRRKLEDIATMVIGQGPSEGFDKLVVQGVSIDSRTIEPGNLYIPLIRTKDGHDYVQEAFDKGAAAALWQNDHPNRPSRLPLIIVEDSLAALQQLAASYRNELPVKVIGVTGSNGKTTTKDLLDSILRTSYEVHKTKGNLNSQIGVPLTLLAMASDTQFAVIEMGMSERGHIEKLSRIAKPDIAMITMIGVSHLSALGSREEIAAAKLEIIKGLPSGGTLIFHGDEPMLTDKLREFDAPIRLIRFGDSRLNDYYADPDSIHADQDGISFTQGSNKYQLPMIGVHNVRNALAAIAAAEQLGVSPESIRRGLLQASITGMRMEIMHASAGYTIINDAWNASPVSVKAAIDAFGQLTGISNKILVLGDMLELGVHEREFHREIGRNLDPGTIDYVFTVGDLGKEIALAAQKHFPPQRVKAVLSNAEAVTEIKAVIQPADAVLVKGSRGAAMEEIVFELM